jgi:hypothetical protein
VTVAHCTPPGFKEGEQSARVDEGQVMEIQDDRRDAVAVEGAKLSDSIGAVAMSSSPVKAMVATPSFS